MSTGGDTPQSRGDRVRLVREAGGWDQVTFAAKLNEAAERHGLDASYHNTKVSKMETGHREVSLDDAYLVADIDPKQRGLAWLMGVRKVASRAVKPPEKRRATGNDSGPK